jgi:alkane 1-monooxygenase
MRDLKYLLAYLVPGVTMLSMAWLGHWAWSTVVLVFGFIPLLELIAPVSTENVAPEQEPSRSGRRFFDWLLYSNAAILYGVVGWYLYLISFESLTWSEWLGITLGVGIVVGACGINVAHELGHRTSAFEQQLAKCMLLPALYQHFFVEHNRGHHKNVATDLDPASAKKGELVFVFWVRSIAGGWRSAWALERDRLAKTGRKTWIWQNAMVRFTVYQSLWLLLVLFVFDFKGLFGAFCVALIGVLLLETVNYLEHYGLRRRQLASGHYEPVGPAHSWNSNHEIGRILLYELTRHSDHHFKSTRKYQILRHIDESPQLPFGYPTAVLLSLVPPVWFAIMHKRLQTTHHP